MKSLYIGKTFFNDIDSLIVTDGFYFSPLLEIRSLDDLLRLSRSSILSITKKNLTFQFNHFTEDFIENQQVWGTGITFPWSEEKISSFSDSNPYKKAYFDERPMFFYKGNKANHSNMNDFIGMRRDSSRNIPEAELIAVFNQHGEVIGFTIGNDQTAIGLEHENVLYQFQAKSFTKSHSFLPMIKLVTDFSDIDISLKIMRNNLEIYNTTYRLNFFRKSLENISRYLFMSNKHDNGIFLYLGFNSEYPPNFTLEADDVVIISSPQFPIKLIQKSNYT